MILLAESRNDVVVTFLTDSLYTQIMRELSKAPKERLQQVENRAKYVSVPPAPNRLLTILVVCVTTSSVINIKGSKLGFLSNTPEFEVVFQELWTGNGSITCASSEKVFTNLPKPDLVILDVSSKLSTLPSEELMTFSNGSLLPDTPTLKRFEN